MAGMVQPVQMPLPVVEDRRERRAELSLGAVCRAIGRGNALVAELARLELCRRHPGYLAEYAFGIQLAPFHWEWLSLILESDRLVLKAARGHGKSTLFSVVLPCWMVGNDPNLRVAVVSATAGQAEKFLREIGYHIRHNPRYRRVFGDLYDPKEIWTQRYKTVRRPKPLKDSTFIAVGVGSGFAGARADILLFDDVVDETNSLTVARRRRVLNWIFETAMPTLDPEGPQRAIMMGTPYHFDDALVHIGNAWPCREYPAIGAGGEVLWPEHFSLEELQRRREEAEAVGRGHVFEMQYLLRLVGAEGNRLLRAWLHESPSLLSSELCDEVWGVDWAAGTEEETEIYAPNFSVIAKHRVRSWGLELYDVVRLRAELPDVVDLLVREVQANGRVRVLGVEQNGIGKVAIQLLGRASGIQFMPVLSQGDKATRFSLMAVEFARKHMTLALDRRDAVSKHFVPEWIGFPFFQYDDCLDAVDVARRAYGLGGGLSLRVVGE